MLKGVCQGKNSKGWRGRAPFQPRDEARAASAWEREEEGWKESEREVMTSTHALSEDWFHLKSVAPMPLPRHRHGEGAAKRQRRRGVRTGKEGGQGWPRGGRALHHPPPTKRAGRRRCAARSHLECPSPLPSPALLCQGYDCGFGAGGLMKGRAPARRINNPGVDGMGNGNGDGGGRERGGRRASRRRKARRASRLGNEGVHPPPGHAPLLWLYGF